MLSRLQFLISVIGLAIIIIRIMIIRVTPGNKQKCSVDPE